MDQEDLLALVDIYFLYIYSFYHNAFNRRRNVNLIFFVETLSQRLRSNFQIDNLPYKARVQHVKVFIHIL